MSRERPASRGSGRSGCYLFGRSPFSRDGAACGPDQSCSVGQGIYGHLTLCNLAVLTQERGDMAGSAECWRNAQATTMS